MAVKSAEGSVEATLAAASEYALAVNSAEGSAEATLAVASELAMVEVWVTAS